MSEIGNGPVYKKYRRELNSYYHARKRCFDENCPDYSYYGGRGITMCERWKESGRNFLEDMGPKPTLDHTLERIDNNGDYDPSNCRWATRQEQSLNRRARGACKYIGVKLHKLTQKWYATVFYKGETLYLCCEAM